MNTRLSQFTPGFHKTTYILVNILYDAEDILFVVTFSCDVIYEIPIRGPNWNNGFNNLFTLYI